MRAISFAVLALLSFEGCDHSPVAVAPTAPACGDVVGAWSSVVSGLRGRLITSGSKADHSAIRVVLELENVSGAPRPLELNWDGYMPLGFATFRLDDASGNDIKPDWAFGGNAPSGHFRVLLAAAKTFSSTVHDGPFETMAGARALRIGAFWGRSLPTDGSRRFLRARVTGLPALTDAIAYDGNEPVMNAPRGTAWVGSLDIPAVCIE